MALLVGKLGAIFKEIFKLPGQLIFPTNVLN